VPRLSIIIPCLGGAAEFDSTLVSVLQNRPADCEVLVAHCEPYSDPYSLRGEVEFVEFPAGSLVELINAALDATSGEVVHILGCGLEASEGWTTPALQHFEDQEVAAVSPVVLAADRETVFAAGIRWTLGGARHIITDRRIISRGSGRLRAKILGPLLTAAFFRRDVLIALGGLETTLGDQLADVGIGLAIQALGRLHVSEPASQVFHSAADAHSPLSGFAAGRSVERLFCRSAAAHGWTLALALHALTITGDSLRQAPRLSALQSLAGRGAAWLELGALRAYEQRLTAANDRLSELAELRASVRKQPKRGRQRAEATIPQRRAA
jgi:hypothetical protein